MTTAVKKAADANAQALETAGSLQLKLVQELVLRLGDLAKKLEDLHETLMADKEILENDIAAREAQIEQMNNQIEAQIKLNAEEREFLTELKQVADQ